MRWHRNATTRSSPKAHITDSISGRGSIDPTHWDFYLAYNLFRIAAILQGIRKRVVDGTAASAHAQDAGSRARPMAELGWQQVEKILRRAA